MFDGGHTTPEYSSAEISPHVNGLPLADILKKAIESRRDKACRDYSPKLDSYLPCLDIADYMKRERSYRKRLFYCEIYDCKRSCNISACIRHKGGAVVMDQFVHHCYNYTTNQGAETDLDIQPFVFEKNAYFAELERIKQALAAKEQTDKLILPSALMTVYHNGKEASFFVRSTNKTPGFAQDMMYPGNMRH